MILHGNQMEKAILAAGLAKRPKPQKKPRHKRFTCRICGEPMIIIEGTNTMACSNEDCKQYFIFDN